MLSNGTYCKMLPIIFNFLPFQLNIFAMFNFLPFQLNIFAMFNFLHSTCSISYFIVAL